MHTVEGLRVTKHLVCLSVAVLVMPVLAAAPHYVASELLDVHGNHLLPAAINASGAITGRVSFSTSSFAAPGFLKLPGQDAITRGLSADGDTQVTAINRRVALAGWFWASPSSGTQAWVALPGKQPAWLFGPDDTSSSFATGINDAGHVAGYRIAASGATESFLWSGGQFQWIEGYGCGGPEAMAVNRFDVVVGAFNDATCARRAFRWEAGQIVALPSIDNKYTIFDIASAINSSGLTVGTCTRKGRYSVACGWRNGRVHALLSDDHAGGAVAVNDAGVAVGWSDPGAVMFPGDGTAVDLNAVTEGLPPYVHLTVAIGIDAQGNIVARTGDERGFLLTLQQP